MRILKTIEIIEVGTNIMLCKDCSGRGYNTSFDMNPIDKVKTTCTTCEGGGRVTIATLKVEALVPYNP